MGNEISVLLGFFDYGHLQADLQAIVAPFAALAHWIANGSANCQTRDALHYLLLSKDAAVRAALLKTGRM
jgi:hypothetical protein